MQTPTTRAARATETGISRRAAAALLLAVALAGCGSTSSNSFGWLRPAARPAGWSLLRIPSGAAIAYPSGWERLHGDPGSGTVALRDAGGRFLGYLNLTPRQGEEQLATWATFRVDHNREEGDRQVVELGHAGSLRFRNALGSCVSDRYVTQVGTRYHEIACLVVGAQTATVVVGAAPPGSWSRVSPALQRAISTLTT
jgi:hypothetical protein